jgi:quinol monooxygenase YgiN
MHVLPKKHKEVTQTLLSIIEPMGKEKGCLNSGVFCDMEDENSYSLIEEWETREDLDRHIVSKKFSVLLGVESLLNGPLEIQIHTVSHSEGMEAVNATRKKGPDSFLVTAARRHMI